MHLSEYRSDENSIVTCTSWSFWDKEASTGREIGSKDIELFELEIKKSPSIFSRVILLLLKLLMVLFALSLVLLACLFTANPEIAPDFLKKPILPSKISADSVPPIEIRSEDSIPMPRQKDSLYHDDEERR